MKNRSPKVTVLMPVYNGERYLHEAIDSILNQTYSDFEFLIINDGSTDKSMEIIKTYKDQRIRLITNKTNLKLIASLNLGFKLARGQYIARMDCDDISLPDRLFKQVTLMDNHPEIGVCGTWLETFGEVAGRWEFPSEPEEIKCHLFFNSVLAHPTVMIRRSKLNEFGLSYNITDLHAEDYGLWQRCSFYFPLTNIPEILLRYRITSGSVSRVNSFQKEETVKTLYRKSLHKLRIDVDDDIILTHRAIATLQYPNDKNFLDKANQFLTLVKESNLIYKIYPEPFFSRLIGEKWYRICYSHKQLGITSWLKFVKSPVYKSVNKNCKQHLKFILYCLRLNKLFNLSE